jgi:5-formyltetrahydrofolate cyclo-ligase
MLKVAIRQEALLRRSSYTHEEIAFRSQRICDHFFASFSLNSIGKLHLFLPIGRQKELDTWLLVNRLRTCYPEVNIVVPVANLRLTSLTHHLLLPDTPLVENPWGIPEPVGTVEVPPAAIDMVLLPLLAFDLKGNRVGYGKGFYDRFLTQCRPGVMKVGLSLEPPLPQVSDANPFDIALDAAVTPEEVFRFWE